MPIAKPTTARSGDFQMVPTDGRPPRLIRFDEDVRGARLDVPNNVLWINPTLWDTLDAKTRLLLEKVSPEEIKRWQ